MFISSKWIKLNSRSYQTWECVDIVDINTLDVKMFISSNWIKLNSRSYQTSECVDIVDIVVDIDTLFINYVHIFNLYYRRYQTSVRHSRYRHSVDQCKLNKKYGKCHIVSISSIPSISTPIKILDIMERVPSITESNKSR